MSTIESKKILILDSGHSSLEEKIRHLGFTYQAFQVEENEGTGSRLQMLEKAREFQPQLMIGDFFGPACDKWIQTIRRDPVLANTPIILCAAKDNICKMIRKINGNVNDYMVQPYAREELLARIVRVLSLHEMLLNTNPLSHLPGNISIKEEITRRSRSRSGFSVIYLDLDHFKAFNDYYGYSKGDEVIQRTAGLFRYAAMVEDTDPEKNFIGHIGGDDFVIIRPIKGVDEFCRRLLNTFDGRIHEFYNDEDSERGFILSLDRKGHLRQFPMMTLSAAVVVNHPGEQLHFGEISARGSEIKHYLKSLEGSNCLIDRRRHKTAVRRNTLTPALLKAL